MGTHADISSCEVTNPALIEVAGKCRANPNLSLWPIRPFEHPDTAIDEFANAPALLPARFHIRCILAID